MTNTGLTADTWRSGVLPLQHPTFEKDGALIGDRFMRHAFRIVGRLDGKNEFGLGHYIYDEATYGEIIGALVWPPARDVTSTKFDFKDRESPAWSWAFPAVAVDLDEGEEEQFALPMRTTNLAPDLGFIPLPVAPAPFARRLPHGTVGIVLDSIREDKQEQIFFHSHSDLVAVNFAGDPARATLCFDLNDANELDPMRAARIHSAWRVVRTRPGCGPELDPELNGLAWQLGPAGRDSLEGIGLCYDLIGGRKPEPTQEITTGGILQVERGTSPLDGKPYQHKIAPDPYQQITQDTFPPEKPTPGKPGSPPTGIVALAGRKGWGPFDVGDANDVHRLGTTADGEPINSLHISTSALYRGQSGDGPLAFEPFPWQLGGDASIPWNVHLRWDPEALHPTACGTRKGMWKWMILAPEIPCPPWIPFDPEQTTADFTPYLQLNPQIIEREEDAEGERIINEAKTRIVEQRQVLIENRKNAINRKDLRSMWTHLERCGPGFSFKPEPTLNVNAFDDTRYQMQPDIDLFVIANDIPVVCRIESWGNELGNRIYIKTNESGTARYVSGTGAGGLAFMNPELDISDILDDTGVKHGQTESVTFFAIAGNAQFAIANPAIDGGIKEGWTIERDLGILSPNSTPALVYEAFDLTGAQDLDATEIHTANMQVDGNFTNAIVRGKYHDARVQFATVSTVTIGTSGETSVVRDSTNALSMEFTGTLTADFATDLDVGVVAANTWYAVHVTGDTTGTNTPSRILSLSATAPALPGTHDVFQRVGWIRTDVASTDIIDFTTTGKGKYRTVMWLNDSSERLVLSGGSATTPTAINCQRLVPPTSELIHGGVDQNGAPSVEFSLTALGPKIARLLKQQSIAAPVNVNSNQEIFYENTSGAGNVDFVVRGYVEELC